MGVDYYVDGDKKRIHPDLLCDRAQATARELSRRIEHPHGRPKDQKYTQLRNFYSEVLMHRSRIEEAGADAEMRVLAFERELPFIRMLAAKATYQYDRQNINSQIRDFISQQVRGIEDERDFRVFCSYFEAVIAFAKGQLKP